MKRKVTTKEIRDSKNQSTILIILDKKLGSGAYGECYLGFSNQTNQFLAIKQIPCSDRKTDPNKHELEKFMYDKELQNLIRLTQQRHCIYTTNTKVSNLVEVYPKKFVSDNHFYLVMEFCDGGDLQRLHQDYQKVKFTTSQILAIFSDILNGYGQMRAQEIVHDDLKPSNILIENNQFKIGDFGLSFKISDSSKEVKRGCTIDYCAIDKFHDKEKDPHLSDIYSLGIIFHQLYYNQHPYFNHEKFEAHSSKKKDDHSKKLQQLTKVVNDREKLKKKSSILDTPEQEKINQLTWKQMMLQKELKRLEVKTKYNQIIQFIHNVAYSQPKVWIKQEKILSQQSHQKLEKMIYSMIEREQSKRPSYEKVQAMFMDIKAPEIIKRDFKTRKFVLPDIQRACILRTSNIRPDVSAIFSMQSELKPPAELKKMKSVDVLCEKINEKILRCNILGNFHRELEIYADKQGQKKLKEIITELVQLLYIYNQNAADELTFGLAQLSGEEQKNFYDNKLDGLISVLRTNIRYLRVLLGKDADRQMYQIKLDSLKDIINSYLATLEFLDERNYHIIMALDLIEPLICDQGDSNLFNNYSKRVIKAKVTSKQATQILEKRKVKLPSILVLDDDDD